MRCLSGKKFYFWLGVMDAKTGRPQDRKALRQNYEGQSKPVWQLWQKVAYLSGYWQTKANKP